MSRGPRPGGGPAPYDVAVIGAGVVGCAIARELGHRQVRAVVVDRASDVGEGTSKANTAILHTGFDTVPGSVESALVRRGHELLGAYAGRTGIATERTGALVVAWDEAQEGALAGLLEKAVANGYGKGRLIGPAELSRREPALGHGARAALAVPDESIICPWSTTLAYATEAVGAGVDLRLGTEITGVAVGPAHTELGSAAGVLRARWVVNAAGLGADLLDAMFGHVGFTVIPRRGQLIVFDKLARSLLGSIVLPVPTERTKGVLVAPTVYGNLLLGPTAEDLADRTDTATTAGGLAGLLEAGRRMVPALASEEVTATYAGLRAATAERDYQIHFHPEQRYVCVGGIRSTGLTASMAIAEHVLAGMDDDRVRAHRRPPPGLPRVPPLGEAQQRPFEQPALIARDPEYGRVVCHCERVTRGELRDALASPVPAADLGGLRRRTRATNGRCQGFYCGAEVAALLADRSR